jgi:hypothetical protein
MKSNYPDKYCNNCEEVTERYAKGNCKKCINNNNKKRNAIRSGITSEMAKAIKDVYRPNFSTESYKQVTIEAVIKETRRNRNCFIYFLVNDDNLVYVGKSNNGILGRINSHIKDKDFDSAYYVAISSEELLDEYERKYIVKYKPKYNKQLFYRDVPMNILDLKTLKVHSWSKNDMVENIGCCISAVEGLVNGHRLKLYNRYILESNRQHQHTYKEILDTHTNTVERHSLISFADKVGVKQNNVWYFFNGVAKSFQKKRYLLVESKAVEIIQLD